MDGFVRLFVDYCQYLVVTAPGRDALEIYTVGDDLVHVGGPARLTAFAGNHTGHIEIRVVTAGAPPATPDDDEWDAVSEATLWCPTGTFSVRGLMGGSADGLTDVPVSRPGLIRVRVRARNRLHETVRTEDDPPEQHELWVWPVAEEPGLLTLRDDGARGGWSPRPAKAAEWAMLGLVAAGPPEPDHRARATVVRRRPLPLAAAKALLADPAAALTTPAAPAAGRGSDRAPGPEHPASDRPASERPPAADHALSAGELEIRLRTVAEGMRTRTLAWRWAARRQQPDARPDGEPATRPDDEPAALPDDEPTAVRLRIDDDGAGAADLTVRHEEVPARDAIALGLIWDHVLDRLAAPADDPPAWDAALRNRESPPG
ncbi:hypothetical protein ACQP2F_04905 [Actinoplanes sp. CA-030573]|uniref:hypothetical protein n=1 Tax=Actinoplanes sp. CA-030573 TaxID=3239898 RepID=UPI003D8ED0BA